MADLDANHTRNRFLHTVYPAKVSRLILAIIELEHTCPSHRHALLLLQSYEQFYLQSKKTDGSFDF